MRELNESDWSLQRLHNFSGKMKSNADPLVDFLIRRILASWVLKRTHGFPRWTQNSVGETKTLAYKRKFEKKEYDFYARCDKDRVVDRSRVSRFVSMLISTLKRDCTYGALSLSTTRTKSREIIINVQFISIIVFCNERCTIVSNLLQFIRLCKYSFFFHYLKKEHLSSDVLLTWHLATQSQMSLFEIPRRQKDQIKKFYHFFKVKHFA